MVPSLAILALAAGCSALVEPDLDRLGPPEDFDAGSGTADAGAMPGTDGGAMPGDDAGPPVGMDGGAPCTSGEAECRGDTLVTCAGGVESPRDCQAESAFCAMRECRPWVCAPSSRVCSEDGSASLACNARGSREQRVECVGGACDRATGACGDAPPDCAGYPELAPGDTVTQDLCAEPDANTFVPQADCDGDLRAASGDRIYALRIERSGRYRIELADDDLLRGIDTILYLRRVCDDPRSQLACSDDTPCSGGGFPIPTGCMDGIDPGRSRLELDLAPGTYYVATDAYVYMLEDGRESECGPVRLTVEPL